MTEITLMTTPITPTSKVMKSKFSLQKVMIESIYQILSFYRFSRILLHAEGSKAGVAPCGAEGKPAAQEGMRVEVVEQALAVDEREQGEQ